MDARCASTKARTAGFRVKHAGFRLQGVYSLGFRVRFLQALSHTHQKDQSDKFELP